MTGRRQRTDDPKRATLPAGAGRRQLPSGTPLPAMVIVLPNGRVNRMSEKHENLREMGSFAIPRPPAPVERSHSIHREA
jgi:hypothetical protein